MFRKKRSLKRGGRLCLSVLCLLLFLFKKGGHCASKQTKITSELSLAGIFNCCHCSWDPRSLFLLDQLPLYQQRLTVDMKVIPATAIEVARVNVIPIAPLNSGPALLISTINFARWKLRQTVSNDADVSCHVVHTWVLYFYNFFYYVCQRTLLSRNQNRVELFEKSQINSSFFASQLIKSF